MLDETGAFLGLQEMAAAMMERRRNNLFIAANVQKKRGVNVPRFFVFCFADYLLAV